MHIAVLADRFPDSKNQARPTRTYLGRWDEETQSIVPTNGKRGRRKKQEAPAGGPSTDGQGAELSACREELARCREELSAAREENARLLKQCGSLMGILSDIHRLASAVYPE